MDFFILPAGLIGLAFIMLLWMVSRIKRCPSDKVLVKYGSNTKGQSAKCIHGGTAFIWPVIQGYEYLDLTPMSIDVNLEGALSKQNIRVGVPSRFTVGISTEPGVMENAAERLLGQSSDQIQNIAKDIIFGQLRLVIAMMDIEEINADRDKFLANVTSNVGSELRKIGLNLINVNITDIQDDSGYIQALGREAAAKAVNDAKKSVAEKDRDGSIGQAEAQQDMRIKVADAEAKARSGEAKANASAINGENEAQVRIANSNAERRQREAEALRLATASEKIQSALALKESYEAEKEAELARAARESASKEADVIVNAEIAKRKAEIDAEAEAERQRRIAKGEADSIFLRKEAEARGMFEILQKQAEGFDVIVKAAGGDARDAVLMLIADKLPELVKTQVEAIKNIKIDKVTVWEGGNQAEGEGNSTSKFISGLYKSVPPMSDLFNMAGMDLPGYLGKKEDEEEPLKVKMPGEESKS